MTTIPDRQTDAFRPITITEPSIRTAVSKPGRMTVQSAFFLLVIVLAGTGGEIGLNQQWRSQRK